MSKTRKHFATAILTAVLASLPTLSFAESMVLVLKTLICHETEDWTGADEPYLVISGVGTIGLPDMNDGDVINVGWSHTVESPAYISLYDADSGGGDNNDHLGTVTATTSMKGQGNQRGSFTQDGAHYTLDFHVE